MQKLLVSTTAAAALLMTSLAAQAADLPQKAYAPAPVMVAAVYDWTGFYIGANGGYGTSRNCWGVVPLGGGVAIPDGCHSQSGGIVGGQVGYRWQAGPVVFGLEAQGDWASLRSSHVSLVNPLLTDSSKVTGLGLFTGQIGYAWNAALLYVKGGAATTRNSLLQATTFGGVGLNYATRPDGADPSGLASNMASHRTGRPGLNMIVLSWAVRTIPSRCPPAPQRLPIESARTSISLPYV
jgi:outer membrane immunogenic protein